MQPARGVFVTGTDTGVGKTLVSCALLAALRARGHRVGVYKPSETGCPRDANGALYGEDVRRLLAAAATGQAEASASAALFATPAAPLVAAEAEGAQIDPDALVAGFDALARAYPAVWVEGAGGLLVPIAERTTFADLSFQLKLPVLVVVGSKLGCLNHALLTLAELGHRNIPVLGTVLSSLPGDGSAAHALATNRATLARFSSAPDLGALPELERAQTCDLGHLASLAEAHLDVGAVERALG